MTVEPAGTPIRSNISSPFAPVPNRTSRQAARLNELHCSRKKGNSLPRGWSKRGDLEWVSGRFTCHQEGNRKASLVMPAPVVLLAALVCLATGNQGRADHQAPPQTQAQSTTRKQQPC